jgi:hypothetical protein
MQSHGIHEHLKDNLQLETLVLSPEVSAKGRYGPRDDIREDMAIGM